MLSPNAPSATGGAHQGKDGGLTGQQSLPSFDNAPLPPPVTARKVSGPYTTRSGAVTGKLFFYRQGDANSGNYYVCSGTVIKSQNASLVWTAGHCVHDGKGGTWHLDMVFVPAFDNADGDPNVDPGDLSAYAPLGTFPAVHVWTSPEWVKTGDEHGGDLAHDYAVIEVGRNADGQTLDYGGGVGGREAGPDVVQRPHRAGQDARRCRSAATRRRSRSTGWRSGAARSTRCSC